MWLPVKIRSENVCFVLVCPNRKIIRRGTLGFLYFSRRKDINFKNAVNSFVNVRFVESLFQNYGKFVEILNDTLRKNTYQVRRSRFCNVFGNKGFIEKVEELYERRKEPSKYLNKREEDLSFEPVQKIIQEFEKKIGMSVDKIDTYLHKLFDSLPPVLESPLPDPIGLWELPLQLE